MKIVLNLIFYVFLASGNLFAQDDLNSNSNLDKKEDKINSDKQEELNRLLKNGTLQWAKSYEPKKDESKELKRLIDNKTLQWSKMYRKDDSEELQKLLDNKILQWSEKSKKFGVNNSKNKPEKSKN